MYNKNNVFAKIISEELPSEKIYEDDILIAIKNIAPVSPVHFLIIPKGGYTDFEDFVTNASANEVSRYFKTTAKIAKENNISEYRLVCNKGESVGQSVFHFHTHLISGFDDLTLIDHNL